MHLWRKDTKCIPAVYFLSEFLVAVNETNYTNEREIIKILKHNIILYVRRQHNTLDLHSNRWTLLMLDVFKGQVTVFGERITEKKLLFWNRYQQTRPTIFQSLDV